MAKAFSSSYFSHRHYLFSVLSIRSKKKKRNKALSRKQNNKKKKQPQAVITLNINQDVVFLILDKLEAVDHVCFAAVCKEWRALSKAYNLTTKRWSKQMVPMLLTLEEQKLRLNSVCTGKIYDNIHLSVPPHKRFCGSSHGWLATVDTDPIQKDAVVIQLWNPFIKLAASPICLPSLRLQGYKCYEVRKVILSVDQSMVVAVTTLKLALFKRGQKDWTELESMACNDVIIYKSRIYGVGDWGHLWSLDVNSWINNTTHSTPPWTKLLAPRDYTNMNKPRYIVESATTGDLLIVERIYKLHTPYPYEPYSFILYKLVFDDYGSLRQQVEIKSIGDEALFVGGNHSVSVLASNFPGCQPNSIYYTTDIGENPKTTGVFNLRDGTIRQLDSLNGLHKRMRLALWIVPQCNGLS